MKKIILSLMIFSSLGSIANAATIDNVSVIDNQNISLTTSSDITFSEIDIDGEIKILKDRKVSFSIKDIEDKKKVILNLVDDLSLNTSYSLITILGADGNIDFNILDTIDGEIINEGISDGVSGITKINILDSKSIEIFFRNDLDDSEFDFKILSEVEVSKLSSTGNNILNIELKSILDKSSDYIAMVLYLRNSMGDNIVFEDDLYDFVTGENLLEKVAQNMDEPSMEPSIEPSIDSNIEEGNIEEIALNSATTPATGAATGVLILLTLIINIIYFGRKRFIK